MKNIKTLLICLGLALTLGFSQMAISANTTFQSEQEINGAWLLQYTIIAGKTKQRGDTWVFANGKMIMKDIPRTRGDRYDTNPVEYKIENGQLKISVLGRPGRFDTYSLLEKTAQSMDFKSNLGEIFHFVKK